MSTTGSRGHFYDLRDELINLKEKIRIQKRLNADEVIINRLFLDGDQLIEVIRNEIDKSHPSLRASLDNSFRSLCNEWNAFKSTTNPPRPTDNSKWPSNISQIPPPTTLQRQLLSQGIESLERTAQSLARAEHTARETEEIGTNIMGELGNQRESLVRTRETLDRNNADLKRSHRLIRTINNGVLTNKLLLIVIIILEVVILISIVYYRFFLRKRH